MVSNIDANGLTLDFVESPVLWVPIASVSDTRGHDQASIFDDLRIRTGRNKRLVYEVGEIVA